MDRNIYLLQHLLIDNVKKYPDNTAIRANGSEISYLELDKKSTRLANHLIKAGIKQKGVVTVILKKSIESVISMIAVLKAGCAYIPLDPLYLPVVRINKIIDLSGAEFIITTNGIWKDINEDGSFETIKSSGNKCCIFIDNLIQDESVNYSLAETNYMNLECLYYNDNESDVILRESGAISEDLAYILYTSGSTGIPKGVMISHLNALTFINWAKELFSPGSDDVISNFAPLHFDLSVFDIYTALGSGACVSMVPYNIMSNPRAIMEWANKEKLTFWYSVPSVWVSILNYARINQGDLESLKYILFAGEVFPPKFLKQLMELVPGSRYFNLYGPTETNVCTFYEVKNAGEIQDKPVPIGISCSNTEILALNDNDEEVSEGEEGELLVRGSIVTKGYYKDPERSNAVFKKSPLPRHNGALFYKTSDIVKKVNNVFEYVARKDFMVKCSGFRVELQEVENAFYQIESIEEVVVVPFNDNINNTTKLYAFIKQKHDCPALIIDIKQQLSKIIPRYMIPDYIEPVDSIMRNQNGKYDRKKLTLLAEKKMFRG